MESHPNEALLKATITSLETRLLDLYEIDRQRQRVVQDITSGFQEQLEAKEVELNKVLDDRDAQAKEAVYAQEQVESQAKEKKEIQQQLEMQVLQKEEMQQQLKTSQLQLKNALEEVELISLQLQQVQEELEYYFLLSKHQDELLSSYSNLQQRIAVLISRSIYTSITD